MFPEVNFATRTGLLFAVLSLATYGLTGCSGQQSTAESGQGEKDPIPKEKADGTETPEGETDIRAEVLKLVEETKTAFHNKDHEKTVSLLYPAVVKSAGGKEKMIELLEAEHRKNEAAGMVIESLDLSATNMIHSTANVSLTFVRSDMIVKVREDRILSRSFYVAFSLTSRGSRWYLLDGTRLSSQQFTRLFPDLAHVELPPVEKKFLPSE